MALLFPRLGFAGPRLAVQLQGEAAAELSYAALERACAAQIAALEARGLGAGDRVAVWALPRLETVVALVANALGGFVSIPLDPKIGESALAHVIADSRPALALSADPERHRPRAPGLPIAPASPPLGAEAGGRDRQAAAPRRAIDDRPLLILYTSGTTGMPKGAVLTARNVAANIDALAQAWLWSDADTLVHALPLFHVHGLVLGLFGSLRVGAGIRLLERFSPEAAAGALRQGGTLFFGVPTMYHRLADAAEAEADGSIAAGLRAARLLISGSAGLPIREHRRIEALTGRGVLERYGLTETLINCAVPATLGSCPGRVGPPLPGVELALLDESGRPLDVHDDETIAEIAVRSPSVFAGYLNRPEATAEALDPAGWFRTGDLATRDAEGSLRIVGRRSTDLIKTGGYRVGAGEIEACLLEDPALAEVAVLGLPDEDLGERIAAFLVIREGHEGPSDASLIERVVRSLGAHKRPRELHRREALPRNAMGKVIKRRLLEEGP